MRLEPAKGLRAAAWCALLAQLAGPVARAAPPAFSDQTAAAGIAVTFSSGAGYLHWTYTGGGAVGDFDRDGFPDLFVLAGNNRDKLYINNGNGTFTDRALDWNLTAVHKGKGASVGDFNGDGWLDLYVTSAGATGSVGPCKHKLYRNNGDETFTDVAAAAGVQCSAPAVEDGFGSAFGDYDLDGDLDLFVAGFAANNAGSRLFQNDGDGTFTDVTASIGLFAATPPMSAFAPRWADMDGDGYPEMLLEADFGTARYFRNDGDGTFTDVTDTAGTSLEENGMGQTLGDFNGDGLLDFYVTSTWYPPLDWTGNKLYLNLGNHQYDEVGAAAGVHVSGYAWGTVAVDFDHDGWLDLLATNGDANPSSPFANEQSYLWINDGDGTFTEQAIASGLVHYGEGRGMVNLDYDADGDQDVVIFANAEPVRLFRNDLAGPATSSLTVTLDTRASPGLAPDGVGSRVWVTSGGLTQLRYISAGDNYLSQSELAAHFGLGDADQADLLEVRWPDGQEAQVADVPADRSVTLVARGACAPAPAAVAGLEVDRLNDGLLLTWTNTIDADDYVVLEDGSPSGAFALLAGTSLSGASGLTLSEMPDGNRFYLVFGRDDGCIGP
jgi:hypothetical protein